MSVAHERNNYKQSCEDRGIDLEKSESVSSAINIVNIVETARESRLPSQHSEVLLNCAKYVEKDGKRAVNFANYHKCPQCVRKFRLKIFLLKHIKSAHRKYKTYNNCPKCKRSFANRYIMKTHIKSVHSADKRFKCEKCNHAFSVKGNMEIHYKTVHQQVKLFECNECGHKFPQKFHLLNHLQAVHNNMALKTFKCNVCSASYHHQTVLTKHILAQHHPKFNINADHDSVSDTEYIVPNYKSVGYINIGRFTCGVCERKYIFKHNVESHLKQVHNLNYIELSMCSKCNKGFPNATMLSDHIRIVHNILRPCEENVSTFLLTNSGKNTCTEVELEINGSSTFDGERLSIQPTIHIAAKKSVTAENDPGRCFKIDSEKDELVRNMKMFLCQECGYKFSSKQNVKRHLYNVHKNRDVKVFKCTMCSAAYCREKNLKKHCQETHNPKFNTNYITNKCNGKVFQSNGVPETKSDIKSLTCGVCKLIFSVEPNSEGHTDNTHCPTCSERSKEYSNEARLLTLVRTVPKAVDSRDTVVPSREISPAKTDHLEQRSVVDDDGVLVHSKVCLELASRNQIVPKLDVEGNFEEDVEKSNNKVHSEMYPCNERSSTDSVFKREICNVTFCIKKKLRRHVKVAHKQKFNCKQITNDKEISKTDRVVPKMMALPPGDVNAETFACGECTGLFSVKFDLESHLENIHYRTYIKFSLCSKCNVGYSNEARLLKHMMLDHDVVNTRKSLNANQINKADDGDKETNGAASEMMSLLPGDSNIERVICGECTLIFPTKYSLESHMEEVHYRTYIKLSMCSKCKEGYSNEARLLKHIRASHATVAPGDVFQSQSVENADLEKNEVTNVGRGTRVRTKRGGNMPLQSNDLFTTTNKAHLEANTKQPIQVENNISDRFKNDSANSYKANAVKMQMFPCDECCIKFSQQTHLTRHLRNIHHDRGNKSFKCNQCSAAFCILGCLKKHTIIAHNRKLNAKRIVSSISELKSKSVVPRDVGVSKFKRDECKRVFPIKLGSEVHISSAPNRSFIKHLMCYNCNKRFPNKTTLSKHKRTVHNKVRTGSTFVQCKVGNTGLKDNESTYSTTITSESINIVMEQDCNVPSKYDKGLLVEKPDSGKNIASPFKRNVDIENGKEIINVKECDVKMFKPCFVVLKRALGDDNIVWFACGECHCIFSCELSLEEHMESIHYRTFTKLSMCSECNEGYSNEARLSKHLRAVHNILYPENTFTVSKVGEINIVEYSNSTSSMANGESTNFVVEVEGVTPLQNDNELLPASRGGKAANRKSSNSPTAVKEYEGDALKRNLDNRSVTDHVIMKKFPCEECGSKFLSKSHMERHMNNVHKNRNLKRFKCSMCSAGYFHNINLEKHLQIAHNQKFDANHITIVQDKNISEVNVEVPATDSVLPEGRNIEGFTCGECKLTFSVKLNLEVHMENVHCYTYIKLSMCFNCNEGYSNQARLLKHVNTVHNIVASANKCDKVGDIDAGNESTVSTTNSREAILNDTEQECDQSLPNDHELIPVHRKVHLDQACGNPVTVTNGIEDDIENNIRNNLKKADMKGKSFPCNKCGYKFMQKSHVIRHLKTVHSKNAKGAFKCKICNAVFCLQNHLKRHFLTAHNQTNNTFNENISNSDCVMEEGDIGRYKCSECMRSFFSQRRLEDHMEKVHYYACTKFVMFSKCNKRYPNEAQLINHVNTVHTIATCGSINLTANSNSFHIKSDKIDTGNGYDKSNIEKLFPCEECGYKFASKYHMERHLNNVHRNRDIKDFKCTMCSAAYTFKKNLRKHLQITHNPKFNNNYATDIEDQKVF